MMFPRWLFRSTHNIGVVRASASTVCYSCRVSGIKCCTTRETRYFLGPLCKFVRQATVAVSASTDLFLRGALAILLLLQWLLLLSSNAAATLCSGATALGRELSARNDCVSLAKQRTVFAVRVSTSRLSFECDRKATAGNNNGTGLTQLYCTSR